MNIAKAFEKSIVIYTSGNFIQKRMAYRISCALSKMTGMEIPFGKEAIKRTAARFVLKDNKALTKGDWKITVKGKTVTMSVEKNANADTLTNPVKVEETKPVETQKPDPTPGETGIDYVLNTNTKKFHYPSCSSVKKMSEKKKKEEAPATPPAPPAPSKEEVLLTEIRDLLKEQTKK